MALTRRRLALCASLAALLAISALAACVRVCSGLNVLSENRVRLQATLISSAAGWIILAAADLYFFPARAECRHAERILQKEPVSVCGVVERVSGPRRIRGSIDIREVILKTDGGTVRLLISRKRSGGFPAPGSNVALLTADGYITAYEVRHE